MKDLLIQMFILGVPGGPRSGQVGVMLGLSWHLNAILKEVKLKTPIRSLWKGVVTISRTFGRAREAPGEGI